MNRKWGAAFGIVGSFVWGASVEAASREDRVGAEALVSAYTEAWNRQDRGAFSIVLQEDAAFADVLARFPHDPRRPAEAGTSRLETRVVGLRTVSADRIAVEVEWRLAERSGRLLHTVDRRLTRYEIAATAERPHALAAVAQ